MGANTLINGKGSAQTAEQSLQLNEMKALGTDFTCQYDEKPAKRPLLIPTNRYNLVNAWNLALFSALAYKPNYRDPDANVDGSEDGELGAIYQSFREDKSPKKIADYVDTGFIEEGTTIANVACFVPQPEDDVQEFNGDILFIKEDTSAKAIIVFEQDRVIITVRGTDPALNELTDGVTDLDAVQVKLNESHPGYLHKGFKNYAEEIYDSLIFSQRRVAGNFTNKDIFITGHSLGGAAALIIMSLLERDKDTVGFRSIQLYTYGMPRAATEAYLAKYQHLTHFRHVNHNDVVPTIPNNFTEFVGVKGTGMLIHKTVDVIDTMTNYETGFWSGFGSSFVKLLTAPITLVGDRIQSINLENYTHHGERVQIFTLPRTEQPLLLSNLSLDDAETEYLNGIHERGAMSFSVSKHFMESYLPNLEVITKRWFTHSKGEPLYPLNREALQADIAQLETEYQQVKRQYQFSDARERSRVKLHEKVLKSSKRSLEMLDTLKDDAISPQERLIGEDVFDKNGSVKIGTSKQYLSYIELWAESSNITVTTE